jgi:hypothetical protein
VAFDADVPHLSAMRHVLEHFDDYAQGTGHLQQPGVPPGQRRPDEQQARRFPISWEASPGRFVLWAGELSIEAEESYHAAERLHGHVYLSLRD